jgi:methylenetetrahydrofolate dehydrogenase (NADP+)/methenyltetrahydrofolate cyclohydrolase
LTAKTLDGEALAATIREELRSRIEAVTEERGRPPGLGTLLVGDDEPSARYVAMKHRDCAEIGITSVHEHLGPDTTQEEILEVVRRFNEDPSVDAYLMQYPFPDGFDYWSALLAMDPDKDVDGLHFVNLGRLVTGDPGPLPCTPHGIQVLLDRNDVPIVGRHVVIVGRGLTIGRPLANLLSLKRPDANAAVTVVHTGVDDIGAYTREADILVAAAGSPACITADMVKPGAAVIQAGVTYSGRKVLSDCDESVVDVAGWISPRIGGVGPMTRAMLLTNAVDAAERHSLP